MCNLLIKKLVLLDMSLFIIFDVAIEISLLQFKSLKWEFFALKSSCHTKKASVTSNLSILQERIFIFIFFGVGGGGGRGGSVTKIGHLKRILSWSDQ
jgi:hypothetical protein